MHLAHTPLYWPTRIFIAELHAENIVQRHREAEERSLRLELGRLHEAAGDRRPREMARLRLAGDRTRLIPLPP